MKTNAGELCDVFVGSRGQIGNVDMRVDNVLERMLCIDYARIYKEKITIGVKTHFDTGSDGGVMTTMVIYLEEVDEIMNKMMIEAEDLDCYFY